MRTFIRFPKWLFSKGQSATWELNCENIYCGWRMTFLVTDWKILLCKFFTFDKQNVGCLVHFSKGFSASKHTMITSDEGATDESHHFLFSKKTSDFQLLWVNLHQTMNLCTLGNWSFFVAILTKYPEMYPTTVFLYKESRSHKSAWNEIEFNCNKKAI